MSDKQAEGTIGRRFYAGCRNVDAVEVIVAEHAKALFGARHAYVQPHSGIDANLVGFWAVLAGRVKAPRLRRASAKHANDLTEIDWAALRVEFGSQRMLGCLSTPAATSPTGPAQYQRQDVRAGELGHRALDRAPGLRRSARAGPRVRPLILMAGYSAFRG